MHYSLYLRMVISMLKIRRPLGRLIFNMGIAIPGKTVFLIETASWVRWTLPEQHNGIYQSCCLMQSIFHLIISQQISTICCATIYQCLLPVLMKQKWLIDWHYERHKPPSVQVFEVKLVPNKNGIIKCEYIFTKNYACARKCIHSSPCDAIWW